MIVKIASNLIKRTLRQCHVFKCHILRLSNLPQGRFMKPVNGSEKYRMFSHFSNVLKNDLEIIPGWFNSRRRKEEWFSVTRPLNLKVVGWTNKRIYTVPSFKEQFSPRRFSLRVKFNITDSEIPIFRPQKETKTGMKNQLVRESGVKLHCSTDWREKWLLVEVIGRFEKMRVREIGYHCAHMFKNYWTSLCDGSFGFINCHFELVRILPKNHRLPDHCLLQL